MKNDVRIGLPRREKAASEVGGFSRSFRGWYKATVENTALRGLLVGVLFLVFANARSVDAEYRRTTTTTTTTVYNEAPPSPDTSHHRYLNFRIDVKPSFVSNERVRGNITVENHYSEPLSEVFNIKLYHNDQLYKELETTAENLLPGQTTFSLDKFGIPTINQSLNSQGQWTIVIRPKSLSPAQSQEASFRILPGF